MNENIKIGGISEYVKPPLETGTLYHSLTLEDLVSPLERPVKIEVPKACIYPHHFLHNMCEWIALKLAERQMGRITGCSRFVMWFRYARHTKDEGYLFVTTRYKQYARGNKYAWIFFGEHRKPVYDLVTLLPIVAHVAMVMTAGGNEFGGSQGLPVYDFLRTMRHPILPEFIDNAETLIEEWDNIPEEKPKRLKRKR